MAHPTPSAQTPFAAHRLKLKASLALAAAPFAGALPLAARAETAAEFPTRPVRWICPTSTGAGTDAAARLFAQIASDTWKMGCVVDNRSGASGMIGLEMLAAAPPDGYTLCLMSVSQFLDGTLAGKFVFDAKKDFTPLSQLAAVPLILVVNPSTKIKSLKELVAYAKAHPNELNYSSGGAGGITHFAMESFLKKAGIKITHVPYKGSGPAVADLLAGHVQLTFSTPAGINAYVKAGKLTALGVSAEKQTELAPGVPTFDEQGLKGIYISTWYGFFGPANMPPDLVARIAGSVVKASSPKEMRDKIFAAGNDPVLSSPAEFTKFLAAERELWAAVAKDIGFKRES